MKKIYDKPELNIYSISSLQANALSDNGALQPGINDSKEPSIDWDDFEF